MPRVEAYGPQRVDTRPLPNVRRTNAPSPAAFGAELGETAANIGINVFGREQARARNEADEAALTEFDRQVSDWENARIYDPQTGAINTVRGKDTLDLEDKIGEEYDTFASKLEEGLQPRQRLAAAKIRNDRRALILRRLRQHETEEFTRYQQEETKALLANSAQIAIANATDPLRVALEVERTAALLDGVAEKEGLGPEARDALILAAQSQIHVGVINRILTLGRDRDAEQYFEAVRGQISGEQLADVERALDAGSTLGEAQRQSDAIIAAGGTLLEQREKAKAIEDPEVRDRALQYIEHEARIRKQEMVVREEDLMVTAGNLIDQGGLKAVPSTVWVQLTPSQKTTLETYAKRHVVAAGGTAVKTDMNTLEALLTMSSANPEEFLRLNLQDYRNKLSTGDMEQMVRMRASMRTGKSNTAFFASEGIQNEVIDAGLRELGLDVTPSALREDRALSNRVDGFRRAVREALDRQFPPTEGKKPTRADVQSIVDTLIAPTQRAVDGWFRDTPARYAFETAQAQVSTIADVPAAERRKIEAALGRAGVPVTDDKVLELFNQQLQKVRGDR